MGKKEEKLAFVTEGITCHAFCGPEDGANAIAPQPLANDDVNGLFAGLGLVNPKNRDHAEIKALACAKAKGFGATVTLRLNEAPCGECHAAMLAMTRSRTVETPTNSKKGGGKNGMKAPPTSVTTFTQLTVIVEDNTKKYLGDHATMMNMRMLENLSFPLQIVYSAGHATYTPDPFAHR